MKYLSLLMAGLSIALFSATTMASPNKVLFVFSGVDAITLKGGGKYQTGFFLSEFFEAAAALKKAGYEIVYSNPTGKRPALASDSDSQQWFSSEADYRLAKEMVSNNSELNAPRRLSSFDERELSQFSGVFIPGGYAPMEDLPLDKDLGRVLSHFHNSGKPTAAVCHGPVAFLSRAKVSSSGQWAYRGYRMTIVSKAEEKELEDAGQLGGERMYYVEDALRSGGGDVVVAKPWTSHVVRDRELITGQNPMSAKALAVEFVKALQSRGSK